jgi:IBR domain, a half RING-finger domain
MTSSNCEHELVVDERNRYHWTCDRCQTLYKNTEARWHCARSCDYDVCFACRTRRAPSLRSSGFVKNATRKIEQNDEQNDEKDGDVQDECGVCYEVKDLAALLPCEHAVCYQCVGRHAFDSLRTARDCNSIKCPLCSVLLPRTAVRQGLEATGRANLVKLFDLRILEAAGLRFCADLRCSTMFFPKPNEAVHVCGACSLRQCLLCGERLLSTSADAHDCRSSSSPSSSNREQQQSGRRVRQRRHRPRWLRRSRSGDSVVAAAAAAARPSVAPIASSSSAEAAASSQPSSSATSSAEVDDATRAFLERTAKQCPGCLAWLAKDGACSHMVCPNCKTNFCFICRHSTPTEKQWNAKPHYRLENSVCPISTLNISVRDGHVTRVSQGGTRLPDKITWSYQRLDNASSSYADWFSPSPPSSSSSNVHRPPSETHWVIFLSSDGNSVEAVVGGHGCIPFS